MKPRAATMRRSAAASRAATDADHVLRPPEPPAWRLGRRRRARPRRPSSPVHAAQNAARAASWLVYVLVAATASSAPAPVASTRCAVARQRAVRVVGDGDREGAAGARGGEVLGHVGRLAALADADHEAVAKVDAACRTASPRSASARPAGTPARMVGEVLAVHGGVVAGAARRVEHEARARRRAPRAPPPRTAGGRRSAWRPPPAARRSRRASPSYVAPLAPPRSSGLGLRHTKHTK